MKMICKPTNEVFGEIPSDWGIASIGDVAEVRNGLTYSPNDVGKSGTLVLRSGNVQSGQLDFRNNVFVTCDVNEKHLVDKNDIIVCVRNGSRNLIGKCALIDGRARGQAFGAFMAVLRSEISEFIVWQFRSDLVQRQIREHLGATINQITNKSLKSFKVLLPNSRHEQKAIAEALADSDALIVSLEKLICKKREITRSAINSLICNHQTETLKSDWEECDLASLGTFFGGLMGKNAKDFGKGASLYVPFKSIIDHHEVKFADLVPVNVQKVERQNSVHKNDLLFNVSSETAEEAAQFSIVPFESDDVYLNSFCAGFRLHKNDYFNAKFLLYWLRGDLFRKQIMTVAQGSTRYNLSPRVVGSLIVRIPNDTELRKRIVDVLDTQYHEIESLELSLIKAKQIKAGMMQELLTGKTRLV